MITRDVDIYAREKYGTDIIHVFGTDTLESMPSWDGEGYAAKKIHKLFVPRLSHRDEGSYPENKKEIPYSDWIASYLAMTKENGIENFELFTDCHIPQISSTELRASIPEHTSLGELFSENKRFCIPGLSRRISEYILENRLYREIPAQKPKVLVHVCCGPDVTMPILQLRDEYDVVCFWYDPNIQPKSEYDKRYEAFVKICEIENIPYIK